MTRCEDREPTVASKAICVLHARTAGLAATYRSVGDAIAVDDGTCVSSGPTDPASSAARSARRRVWFLVMSAVLAVLGLCVAFEARRVRCVGDCRGTPLDCAGVDRWTIEMRTSELLSPHTRVHRVTVPTLRPLPCRSERWAPYSELDDVAIALAAAERWPGPTVLALRYGGEASCGGPVYFEVLGIELTGYQYWLGRLANAWGAR